MSIFSRNEKPVIVKFLDGTYGIRKKSGGKYWFMDSSSEYWWEEEKRYKYCRFESLEAAKIMNDVGEVVKL